MTSKIIVNNIGSDTGINTVTFDSNLQRGTSNLHSTGLNVSDTFLHSTGLNIGTGATIHQPADNVMTLGTNGSERLRIDSSGNVDIASGFLKISNDIKSSDDDFYVYSYKGGSSGQVRSGIQYDGNSQRLRFFTGVTEHLRISSTGRLSILNNNEDIDMDATCSGQLHIDGNGYSGAIALNATAMNIYTNASSRSLILGTNETERIRILPGGTVLIKTTTDVFGGTDFGVKGQISIANDNAYRRAYLSGSNNHLYFWNGSNQPYISSGGSFVNASDQSLKKDITDLSYGIDVLKNLKPRKYKMKADNKEQIGFIAQEVELIIPEVVDTGETPDGTEQKGLSYGHLTSVLTKALQEAITKIETLESKVATLEGS